MTIDIDKLEKTTRAASEAIDVLPNGLTPELLQQTPEFVHAMTSILRFAVEAPAVLELVASLRAAERDVERANKRADFYQERAAAGLEALDDVSKAVCRSSMPIAEQQPMLARIGKAQEKHGEAGRAFMERLRAAERSVLEATSMNIRDMRTVSEYNALYHRANDRVMVLDAIVRDLAASENDPEDICPFCGARRYKGISGEPHTDECLITRARQATKP